MSLLDNFEQYNKNGRVSITQLSICKSGFAIFSTDFSKRYLLGKDFETLSFFLSKTNGNVLGIRFLTDNRGRLKITKRLTDACCCAMALIKELPEYIGKYKIVGTENHKDYTDCLFEKVQEEN